MTQACFPKFEPNKEPNSQLFTCPIGKNALEINQKNYRSTKKPRIVSVILLLLLLLQVNTVFGQEETQIEVPVAKAEYFRFFTGFALGPIMTIRCKFDIYNIGMRIFGEYQRELSKNWFYGISFDGMIPATGNLVPLLKNVSVSAYFRWPIIRERLFLLPGLGLGCNFIFIEDEPLRLWPTTTVNISMLLQVSPNAFLEFSPLLIYPTRMNFPLGFRWFDPHPHNIAFAVSILSIGFKIKL